MRAWHAAHPEYNRVRMQSKRASSFGTPANLSSEDWESVKAVFGYACAYCLRTGVELTIDHVVDLADGGTHDTANVVPACRSCNGSKKNRGVLSMINQAATAALTE